MRRLLFILLFILPIISHGQELAMPVSRPCVVPAAISGTLTCATSSMTTLSDATPSGYWFSSTTATATVGYASGVVSGVASGTSTITYTTGIGCTATATFTVTAPVITYATWSPTNKSSAVTLSSGNTVANGSAAYGMCIASIGHQFGAGQLDYYYEFVVTAKGAVSETIGISDNVPTSADITQTVGRIANSFGSRWDALNWDYSYNIGAGWATSGTGTVPMSAGDVIGYEWKGVARTLTVYVNNVLKYTSPALPTGVTFYPAMVSNTGSDIITAHFTAASLTYTNHTTLNQGFY